jgi:hypothetical protein
MFDIMGEGSLGNGAETGVAEIGTQRLSHETDYETRALSAAT